MGRIATNVEEQLKILSDKGIIFDCGIEKAKEHLLDIGYYRLGFYWFHFKEENLRNFKPNTKFSTIIDLYYLDVDLKFLLMRALNRIEINIRTQIIYIVSNKYKNSPTWFSDHKVMTSKFIEGFPNIYNEKFIDNNKPIKKHHNKYINDIYAPAWKTLEFLTFGSIYNIFLNLKDEKLKTYIANHYGIKKSSVFINYLRTIIFIRNICAHSGLLYDTNTPLAVKPTNLIKINNNNRHSLNTAIQVIIHFLGVISSNRKRDLQTEIDRIFIKYSQNENIKNIIETKIGYNFM
ncbi:MAG: DNA-binding protein [Bacteroidia bacterium]|nr:MAG: DNA-binding protein [Bacteroidia bacterium]